MYTDKKYLELCNKMLPKTNGNIVKHLTRSERKELEKLIIDFTGSTYCSMTTSCTVALFLVCLAIELKVGDEVLMPAYTQAATANGAKMCGANIVFCDVDPISYTISYEEIQLTMGQILHLLELLQIY